jgi:hypothetical protein
MSSITGNLRVCDTWVCKKSPANFFGEWDNAVLSLVLSAIVILRRSFGVRSNDVQGGRYRHPSHVVRVPDDLVDRQVLVGAPIWLTCMVSKETQEEWLYRIHALGFCTTFPPTSCSCKLDDYQHKGGGWEEGSHWGLVSSLTDAKLVRIRWPKDKVRPQWNKA